jgi:hypothetical protein
LTASRDRDVRAVVRLEHGGGIRHGGRRDERGRVGDGGSARDDRSVLRQGESRGEDESREGERGLRAEAKDSKVHGDPGSPLGKNKKGAPVCLSRALLVKRV